MTFKNYINDQSDQLRIGDRNYRVVNLVPADRCICGADMVKQAINMGANLDQHEAFYLKPYYDEIPKEFRMKVELIFADWRAIKERCHSDDFTFCAYSVAWDINNQRWWGSWKDYDWACYELYTLIRID